MREVPGVRGSKCCAVSSTVGEECYGAGVREGKGREWMMTTTMSEYPLLMQCRARDETMLRNREDEVNLG